MAIAIDPKTPIPFVTPSDRKLPVEQQTTFLFLPFTRREIARFEQLQSTAKEGKLNAIDSFIDILKDKLVGWSNFKRQDGTEVVFNNTNPIENFDCIGLGTLLQLFQGVVEINQITIEEIKN